MNEWWQALLTLAIGYALGVVTCLLFRRRGLSDSTGERADSVGQCIDKVVDDITGAEERAEESVRLVSDVADTGRGVAESVERLSEGSDKSEGAIADAEESVGRIRKLIEEERKRNEKPES